MSQRQIGLLMAIITALSWAVLAIGLKFTLNYASSGTIAWFRLVSAFGFLFIYYLIRNPKALKILKQPPFLAIIGGICLGANYFGYMKGVELTTASNAQIMIQLGPLLLALTGVLYFKEIPTRIQSIGFFLGALGFSFFFWDQIRLVLAQRSIYIEGNLWILFAAITWAIFAAFQKVLIQKFAAQHLNMLIYAVASVVLLPIVDFSEFQGLSIGIWILLCILGLNTVVAYGALSEALHRIPASQTSMIITLNPLLTIFLVGLLTAFEVSWLKPEPIEWRGYLGAFMVVCGVILAVTKLKRPTSK